MRTSRMKRLSIGVAVVALATLLPYGSAGAQTTPPTALQTTQLFDFPCSSGGRTTGDFNGDDKPDLAIGAPGDDLEQIEIDGSITKDKTDPGSISVVYGKPDDGLEPTYHPTPQTRQFFSQNTPGVDDQSETGDLFGFSLAVGDFNNDGFDDLLVGVPGEDSGVGGVQVLYGSQDVGLSEGVNGTPTFNHFFRQGSDGLPGMPEAGDNHGYAISAGDINGDSFDDAIIGSPREDVGSTKDAGFVWVIFGSDVGLGSLSAPEGTFYDQSTSISPPPADSNVEAGDFFGGAVLAGYDFDADGFADDFSVGAPGEDVGNVPDGGAFKILYFKNSGPDADQPFKASVDGQAFFTQNTTDVEGFAESGDRMACSQTGGDFDGDGDHDIAIGVPDEAVGVDKKAGMVQALYNAGPGRGITATAPAGEKITQRSLTSGSQVTPPVTESPLTTNSSNVDASTYTTASINPANNRLILASVANSVNTGTAGTPTLTGNDLTWTEIETQTYSGDTHRVTLFRAMGVGAAAPTSGAVTIDFDGETQNRAIWSIAQFDRVDRSGTNGSGAIVQSNTATATGQTSLTVPLAVEGPQSATYGTFATNLSSPNITPESGYSEIHDRNVSGSGENQRLNAQWRNSPDNTNTAANPPKVTATSTTSENWGGIAVEIKAQSTVATASITPQLDELLLLAVANSVTSGSAGTPSPTGPQTVNGNNFDWDMIDTQEYPTDGGRFRVSLFRAMASDPDDMPGPGGVSIFFSEPQHSVLWSIAGFANVEPGNNGADAIRQSAAERSPSLATKLTVDLNQFEASPNATYGAFAHDSGTKVISAGSGFNQIHQPATTIQREMTEWKDVPDRTVDATTTTSANWGGIAVEIGKKLAGCCWTNDQLFTEDDGGIPGVSKPNDRMGAALASGDLNGDGVADIAVGLPTELVYGKDRAGSIREIYGFAGFGLTDNKPGAFAQAPSDLPPGCTLMGVTRKTGLLAPGACIIGTITGSPADYSPTVMVTEKGDLFGASIAIANFNGEDSDGIARDDVAVGAPGEDLGQFINWLTEEYVTIPCELVGPSPNICLDNVADAGIVHVIYTATTEPPDVPFNDLIYRQQSGGLSALQALFYPVPFSVFENQQIPAAGNGSPADPSYSNALVGDFFGTDVS